MHWKWKRGSKHGAIKAGTPVGTILRLIGEYKFMRQHLSFVLFVRLKIVIRRNELFKFEYYVSLFLFELGE